MPNILKKGRSFLLKRGGTFPGLFPKQVYPLPSRPLPGRLASVQ